MTCYTPVEELDTRKNLVSLCLALSTHLKIAKIVRFAFPTNFMEVKNSKTALKQIIYYFLLPCFLGLERLLRDGKAGWVMGASNEVLRQVVGKRSLFGPEAIDFW